MRESPHLWLALMALVAIVAARPSQALAMDALGLSTDRTKNPACTPFEGSEKVSSLAGVVFIGEHHGTRETPLFFGSLVCNVGKHNRRIHLAFEQPADWTTPLGEFLNSGESPDALAKFLRVTNWESSVKANPDGRTSRAFIELLQYLRRLRSFGYQISVSAFDTRPWESPKINSDIGMAAMLTRNIEENPADLTFVLSGELHTRLLENTSPWKPQPMAFLVSAARPTWRISSIVVTYSAGTMWGCSATACGELNQPVQVPLGKPKLAVSTSPDSFGYAGDFYIGAISSSPPYIPQ